MLGETLTAREELEAEVVRTFSPHLVNHKEEALIISAAIITLIASSVWYIRNQEALANLLLPRSNVINQS